MIFPLKFIINFYSQILHEQTWFIGSKSKLILSPKSSFKLILSFALGQKMLKQVLSIFNLSLLAENQLFNTLISSFVSLTRFSIFLLLRNILVSSANSLI